MHDLVKEIVLGNSSFGEFYFFTLSQNQKALGHSLMYLMMSELCQTAILGYLEIK